MLTGGCRYGTHRVLNPEGTLPQPAQKLDNTMEIYEIAPAIKVGYLLELPVVFTAIITNAIIRIKED